MFFDRIASHVLLYLVLLGALSFACGCGEPIQEIAVDVPPPPATEARPVVDTINGVEIEDPYRWLEDQNSEETREWIGRQNSYTKSVFSQLPNGDIFQEQLQQLNEEDIYHGVYKRGNRFFYSKQSPRYEHPVICMREGFTGEERLILNPADFGENISVSFFSLSHDAISPDGRFLAFYIQHGGSDEVEGAVLNVDTGEVLPDTLPLGRYFGMLLPPGNEGYYYFHYIYNQGGLIKYHRYGVDPAEDTIVFGQDSSPDQTAAATLSPSGRWLLVHRSSGAGGSVGIYLKDLQASGDWKTVIDIDGAQATARFAGDYLLIRTTLDAPNGRVVLAPLVQPGPDNWREIVPEDAEIVLTSAMAFGPTIVVNYLRDVTTVSRLVDFDGKAIGTIRFPAPGTAYSMSGEDNGRDFYYIFTSYHIQKSVYHYSLTADQLDSWNDASAEDQLADLDVEQIFYTSRDGTRVPMFLMHRKDLRKDGSNPVLLYGYGGFGSIQRPVFDNLGAAWARNGGIYAVANIRGGGEYGEAWHDAGKMLNKQNSFDDFIAAAEYLISEKYTSSEHIGIMGGSNGGLLVCAVATQRPHLVGAVISEYAALDMIRYHLFPPADWWRSEYGTSEDPEQFRYLLSYSPYHNVHEGEDYPAMLLITGDADTRVAPLHTRKMTAMLQAKNSGKNPVFMLYHDVGGHAGGLSTSQQIEKNMQILQFLSWRLGLRPVDER